ncbi:TetR/AcrR family transcriptional regulator [Levilactobacillus lanxiensis]|uniref:TetR/AcrR family transcriptional regulator n=1 Tax=Levilactobacillus lanxiensis TaxID=2799568 RepID=A0ABW4D5W0_9LACO|nr:TetR/AcrR family transcriptional regulator [Levilactobacillus lanxiensis]
MKLKDEEKHDRLLNAAVSVLAKGGVANFSTTKVAKLAGIPQSNLYIYFQNKEALLEATYRMTVHQQSVAVVAVLQDRDSLTTQLMSSVQALYQFALAQPETVTALQVLLDDIELKHKWGLKRDDLANQRIQQLIQTGVDQHVLRETNQNFIRYFLARPVFHYVEGIRAGLYPDTPEALTDLTAMIMGAVLQPDVYQTWCQEKI